jgi:hypothetical protein
MPCAPSGSNRNRRRGRRRRRRRRRRRFQRVIKTWKETRYNYKVIYTLFYINIHYKPAYVLDGER